MSEEFGTVNLRRGERAREIEVMRQHYRQHREALARMTADAPTEHLAAEYQRLIVQIDQALLKLNELEGGTAPTVARAAAPAVAPSAASRPLADRTEIDFDEQPTTEIPADRVGGSRVPLILGAAVIALTLIGWLIWRASSDRPPSDAIVDDTAASATTVTETVVAEPVVPELLAVSPPSHDYGTIRKGTRATRQFEVANNSEEPLSIQVARSACRCLYYEHAAVIPPKAKEHVTVTIDAAKAKAGELRETVRVTAKSDPTVATSFDVIATIQ